MVPGKCRLLTISEQQLSCVQGNYENLSVSFFNKKTSTFIPQLNRLLKHMSLTLVGNPDKPPYRLIIILNHFLKVHMWFIHFFLEHLIFTTDLKLHYSLVQYHLTTEKSDGLEPLEMLLFHLLCRPCYSHY